MQMDPGELQKKSDGSGIRSGSGQEWPFLSVCAFLRTFSCRLAPGGKCRQRVKKFSGPKMENGSGLGTDIVKILSNSRQISGSERGAPFGSGFTVPFAGGPGADFLRAGIWIRAFVAAGGRLCRGSVLLSSGGPGAGAGRLDPDPRF